MKNRNKLNRLRKNYSKIPNALYNNNLSISAIALYCYLASNSEHYNPSIKTICKALNISKGTADRYLNELKNRNMIRIARPGGQRIVTEYEFLPIETWKEKEDDPILPC